jgi:hypothetical protein
MTTLYEKTTGTTTHSAMTFDFDKLVADAKSERVGSVKGEDHHRVLTGGGYDTSDYKKFKESIELNHSRYYALRLSEMREGKYRPTVVKDFDEARRHYNHFIRQRLPVGVEKLKRDTKQIGVCMIPYMYEIRDGWTEADGCKFNDQWNDGGVNASLGKKDKIILMPTMMGGGTGKPYGKGDVVMMVNACVYVSR